MVGGSTPFRAMRQQGWIEELVEHEWKKVEFDLTQ